MRTKRDWARSTGARARPATSAAAGAARSTSTMPERAPLPLQQAPAARVDRRGLDGVAVQIVLTAARAQRQRRGGAVGQADLRPPRPLRVRGARQAVHEQTRWLSRRPGAASGGWTVPAPARDVVAERLQQQAEGAVEVKAVAAAPALDDPLGGLGVVDRRRPAALDLEVLEDDALEMAGLQLGQRVGRGRPGRLEAQPREVVGDRDAALGQRLLSPSCRRRGRRHRPRPGRM